MPRFYFDINNGERLDCDGIGLTFDDLDAAKFQAVSVLPDVAREVLPDGEFLEISVLVRDSTR